MKKTENTMCTALNAVFGKAIHFLLNLNLNNTMNVFHINKDSLGLNFNNTDQLFCVRLINNSNKYHKYSDFQQLHNSFKFEKNSKIFLYFVKKGLHQAIYIFTLNEDIARQIATDFQTKILKGDLIMEALHDIFLIPVREIKGNAYVNTEYVNELDVLYKQLPQRIAIATDFIYRKYNIYQGVSYQDNMEFNPISFFNRAWNGVFCLMVDLSMSNVERHLKLKKDETNYGDKKMNQYTKKLVDDVDFKDVYEEFINKTAVVNSMLFIDNSDEISALSNELKISFQENYLTSTKIIPKTIINARDTTFDLIIPIYSVAKYFISTHKKVLVKIPEDRKRNQLPDFYGKDINGAFVNYSYYGENSNPHSFMIGSPGSGKSVGICKIISDVVDLDLMNNKINSLDDVKVKFCDVGYTAGGLFEKLREINPEKVQVIDSRIENLRFSLFDIEKDKYLNKADPSDIEFTVYFINTILEVSKVEPLIQMEESSLKEAIINIIENNTFIDLTIGELTDYIPYDEVKEILDKGYTTSNKLSDLKEKEFDRLKKPTLKTLIYTLTKTMSRTDLSLSKKGIYESLINKMESLSTCHNFASFANVDLRNNYPLQYIDFDKIKEDKKLFTSTFWMLFKRWYKKDKEEALKELNKGNEPRTSYYIVEEAHNFFTIPSFKQLLEVATREARKYRIYLIFVTQKVEDIPAEVYSSIATRIFFFQPEKKAELKRAIEFKIGGEDYKMDDEIQNVFDRIRPFQAFIMHDKGATGCDLMVTPEELKLFSPKEIY